jgi:hypothetical protein
LGSGAFIFNKCGCKIIKNMLLYSMDMTSTEVLDQRRPLVCIDGSERRDANQTDPKLLGGLCLFDQFVLSPEALNTMRAEAAGSSENLLADEALDKIYPPSQEACAIRSLVNSFGIKDKIGDTQFAILAVEGSDPRSIAPRRAEAQWFNKEFNTHPSDHENGFSSYSDESLFMYMLDMSDSENPVPSGVLRFIRPSDKGTKTVNVLSHDEYQGEKRINPWFGDFAEKIPGYAEATEAERGKMIHDFYGVDAATTWDVPTMAVDSRYKGHNADAVSPAWGLYVACVNVAMELGAQSFINTQDVAPLKLMQFRFARLWTDERTKDENGERGKYGFTLTLLRHESGTRSLSQLLHCLIRPNMASILLCRLICSRNYSLQTTILLPNRAIRLL